MGFVLMFFNKIIKRRLNIKEQVISKFLRINFNLNEKHNGVCFEQPIPEQSEAKILKTQFILFQHDSQDVQLPA